ncbi:hypothetical protein [Acinetobacter wuhouensis]|uniref:Uncharacterized protein n=1 Tax=Acinetobacter wuhouensis TaxID=1879050 RepID=A0A3G2T2Y4_9GAMM|nr:hypothetical protein [Acinetobacter wuhouensis]AYO54077.1 hypothetical protein CDG68_10720 [Acinetobacter wuhouensis]
MTNTIDGFTFDVPAAESQIVELAQYHRKQLDEAIYHQEIHLGDYCLAQRKRVYDYTKNLDATQKKGFYRVYDNELRRLADDDDLHPVHAEGGVSLFAVVIALVIIAGILYFAFLRAVL